MPRKISLAQGREEIEYILEKYSKDLRDKKVCGIIDTILWSVANGCGETIANSIITQYGLQYPACGSHKHFDDGVDRLRVIELTTETLSDEYRIFPGEKKFKNKNDEYVSEDKTCNWVSENDTFGKKNNNRRNKLKNNFTF